MGELFQGTVTPKGNSELELTIAVEGQVKLEEIGDAVVERVTKKMN